jgi:hypothetical protein
MVKTFSLKEAGKGFKNFRMNLMSHLIVSPYGRSERLFIPFNPFKILRFELFMCI